MSLARAISLIEDRVYTGPAQVLSDPTKYLHGWSLRAPTRNSPLFSATLRRTSDGVEADFATDAQGYLPPAAVLDWAGASAVTVAQLWGSAGTQLGPELVVNSGPAFTATTGWTPSNANASIAEGRMVIANTIATSGAVINSTTLAIGKTYRLVVTNIQNNSGNACDFIVGGQTLPATAITGSLGSYTAVFIATTTGVAFRVRLATTAVASFGSFSVREVLTANAVQTTTGSQPPLDLTATPLRIGALAGRSLVATLPAAITGARILTADENGVAVATANLASGAYTVQSANALRERVVLAADTPEADVESVRRNMMRAWRLGAAA